MGTDAELSEESQSFLDALFADPFLDPAARAALADSLELNGESLPELDLPPGVVVEALHGIPTEIRCRMRQWLEEMCSGCHGFGVVYSEVDIRSTCRVCAGKGRIEGIALRVCKAWPIASVVLVDVGFDDPRTTHFQFTRGRNWEQPLPERKKTKSLDRELFEHVLRREKFGRSYTISFPTQTAAFFAVNRGALNVGRERAGLPLV